MIARSVSTIYFIWITAPSIFSSVQIIFGTLEINSFLSTVTEFTHQNFLYAASGAVEEAGAVGHVGVELL